MSLRVRPARALFSRASKNDVSQDNRLALVDHFFFAQHRAVGRKVVIQCVWIYEHAIDLDGLRRFQHNLGYGLLGRRIESSPLPFGRLRWVADRGPSDFDIAECARPRDELSDWADEHSQFPIDPEWGPGWRLGVLPLTDGSTAVSLVLSHYLIDGLGLVLALVDAVLGNTRDLGYPLPHARSRLSAAVQDAREAARDAPQVARAVVAAAKLARRARRDLARPPGSRPVAQTGDDGDGPIVVPGISIYVDLVDWDARATALGGTSNTLVAALVAKLGDRLGRRRAGDGAVTLQLPLSNRAEGDTRANAMSFATVSVDPTRVTTDLREVRAAIKQALTTLGETPDESSQLLSLVPLMPKWGMKRIADSIVGDPDLPVFYSNLGDVGSVVNRLDGTASEYATARVTAQHETREWLERMGGQMTVQSLRLPGRIVISVNAYQPGAENTKPALRELAARTLAEFDLTGEID